jgi:hypothetical protein
MEHYECEIEAFTAAMFQVEVFRDVTPCSGVVSDPWLRYYGSYIWKDVVVVPS